MPRKHTPEELAEAERLLKEGQPMIDQTVREAKDAEEWERQEIAMLERRVRAEETTIDLGHGDKLRIRSCMSDMEMEEFGRLQKLIQQTGKTGDNAEASYKMLAMTTANSLLTAEWFRDNRHRYSTTDMTSVLIGYYEDQAARKKAGIERVKSAATFRQD